MYKMVKGVGVDAGMILICDKDYYKQYEDKPNFNSDLTKMRVIKPGTYRINWSIIGTWNGPINGDGVVKIESGKMIVSDPCYCISKNWDKWLEDTDYGRNIQEGSLIIDQMGGDGIYNIKLNLELVEEI